MNIKALIISGYGINCEEETAAAFKLCGANSEIHHINTILTGEVTIHDFSIIAFPGGFSFGDDIASGKVLANKIKYRKMANGNVLFDELILFLNEGKFILGICNGFQVLTRLGMIPNIEGKYQQEVSLTHNSSGKFIDDWHMLSVNPKNRSPFLAGLTSLELPIRHGEGRLFIKEKYIAEAIVEQGLNCLTYRINPNGSHLDCAGLTDGTGRILGLMPHPEAYLSIYNHPDWNRRRKESHQEEGEGIMLFKNIIQYIQTK